MNKKIKWAIPFAVLTLTCGVAAGCGGKKHEHSYTDWGYNETQHWKECPEDDAVDEDSKANHNFVDGSCECGATQPETPATYGSVKIQMSLCKLGTKVNDFKGIRVDFGDDNVEVGAISAEGVCEISNVKVGKQYTVSVSKSGYEGVTTLVQLEQENEVVEISARLEFNAFSCTSKWAGWYPTFYHSDEGDHTFKPNDNTVAVHSVERFDDVAATLKVKKSNTTNREGVWLFFEDGGMCPVKITSSSTVEFDTREDYDSWGDNGNLAGNLGVANVTNLFTNADVTDKDGFKHCTGITMTDAQYMGHENGTLELTVVRKANVIYVFVGGKFADMRVLDEKYADQKVRIGYYAMDCVQNVSEWGYGYTTDLSSYFTELTHTLSVTEGIASSVCEAALDRTSYHYGEEMTLTVNLKNADSYYVEGVRVDGKLYELDSDNKLTLRVDSRYDIRVSVYAKETVSVNADAKIKRMGEETELADGTVVTVSGNLLAEPKQVTVAGGKIATALLPGEYIFAAEGYVSAAVYVNAQGVEGNKIVLGYKSAEAVIYGDKADLSGMNDDGKTLKINSSDAGSFEYWANKVPEIKLNLDTKTLVSIDGNFTFNLKAARPNNQPSNNFGIVVAEGYKGVGLSFWNTKDDTCGNFAFELKGQYLGVDSFQNIDYVDYGTERPRNLKWLTEAVYGAAGVDFKVTRSSGTITIQAYNGTEWVTIREITGIADNVQNDIRFMGVGSNYTISAITLDFKERALSTVESAEITVKAATGFTAEGAELTFECLGKSWKGTVGANGKVVIGGTDDPVTVGTHNVYANFGGYLISLGTVDIEAPAEGASATASVTLNFTGVLQGPSPVTANPATGELTFKLGKAEGGAYNDIYDIATIEGGGFFATKLKFDNMESGQRSVTLILKVQQLDGTTKEIKYVVQNKREYFGSDGQFYLCLDDDNMDGNGVFNEKGENTQVNINAFADALKGDGLWLVLGYDAATGGLVAYAGENINSVRLIKTYGNISQNLKVIGMGVGNWFGVGGKDDTASVTLKYGKTMAEIGMAEETKYTVNASLAEGCADMGSIKQTAADGKYYEGTQCTVTVTVKPGYYLKSLKIGDTVIDKDGAQGWEQDGLIYTFTLNITEDTAVEATIEKSATANVTFVFEGDHIPVAGTQIELTSRKDGSVTTHTVGNDAIELEMGVEYELAIYGYAVVIITVPEADGEMRITLEEAAAVADSVEDHVTITADTITFTNSSGNGAFDGWQTTQNPAAKLIMSDEERSADRLVLQFTLKAKDAQKSWNGVFGIGITGYKGVRLMFCTGENAMEDGRLSLADLNSLQLSQDGVSGANYNATYGFIETLAASQNGVAIRALREGTSLKFYAKNADGKWILVHTTTCEEDAENEICFVGNGATYTVSDISVTTVSADAEREDYYLDLSFAGNAYGYKAALDNYIVAKEGGSAKLVIETENADVAWGWFPNAITVNGTAIDFTQVTRESLGANRCRFTYTFTFTTVAEDKNIVVAIASGTRVEYDVTANDATMGEVKCDMTDMQYYWNDLCELTVTPKAGHRFEKLVIGTGSDATEISYTDCTFADGKFTYVFTVTGDIKVVAHFAQHLEVEVSLTVNAKDYDGATSVTLENGTEIGFKSTTGDETYTYTVGGSAVTMLAGTYAVTCTGFCDTTATVGEDGAVTLNLVKPIATSASNEITVSEDKTIAIKGNGLADRSNHRAISADLKMSEEEKNSTGLTLEFTVRVTKTYRKGDDWAASRFGVQFGEGALGFFVFIRDNGTNKADVVKLNANSLDLNPNTEYKWHGDDASLTWVTLAALSKDGLQMKVERKNGIIHVYAKNDGSWVKLSELAQNKEPGMKEADDLTIGNTVKNQIKFIATGDDWLFSDVKVTLPEASEKVNLTTNVNNQTMGKIETDVPAYYKGDKAILTLTANKGYELEKLVVGTAEITEDWQKNGLVYTYELTLSEAETTITAHFREIPVPKVTPNITVTGAKYASDETPTVAAGTKVTLTNAEEGYEFEGTVGADGSVSFEEQVYVSTYTVSAEGYFDTTVTITEETATAIALTLYVNTVDCVITVGETGDNAKFVAEGATLTFSKDGVKKTVTVTDGKVKLENVLTGDWVTTADFGGYELHLGWTTIGKTGTAEVSVDSDGLCWNNIDNNKANQYDLAGSDINAATLEVRLNHVYHNRLKLASAKEGGAMAFKFALPETPAGNFKSVISMPIGLGNDSMMVVLYAEKNGDTKKLQLGYTNVHGGEWFSEGDRLDLSANWDTFVQDGLWIVVELNKDTKAISTYAGATLATAVNQNYNRTFKGSSASINKLEFGNAIDGSADTNLLVTFKYGATVQELGVGAD